VENYLCSKLILKADNKLSTRKTGEMKIENDKINMNLNSHVSEALSSILVKNLIMTDLYSGMSDKVIPRLKSFETGAKMTPEITEQAFKIK